MEADSDCSVSLLIEQVTSVHTKKSYLTSKFWFPNLRISKCKVNKHIPMASIGPMIIIGPDQLTKRVSFNLLKTEIRLEAFPMHEIHSRFCNSQNTNELTSFNSQNTMLISKNPVFLVEVCQFLSKMK